MVINFLFQAAMTSKQDRSFLQNIFFRTLINLEFNFLLSRLRSAFSLKFNVLFWLTDFLMLNVVIKSRYLNFLLVNIDCSFYHILSIYESKVQPFQIFITSFVLRHQHFQKWDMFSEQIFAINNRYLRMDDDHEMFKIVIIGNSGTGKTNISTRYVRNEFNDGQKATVGVQFLYKIIDLHNKKIKVTLWDTAGQEKYKGLSKVYYKGASGVLIVYDITDPQSYLDVESWMKLANQNLNLSEVVLMVVGNKADLDEERKVPTERPIREFKEKFDIDCWEVSAKTGFNVKEIMSEFVEKIYQMNLEPKGSQIPLGESYFGESVVEEQSGIYHPSVKQKAETNPRPIPEVIVEEQGQVRHSFPCQSRKKQRNIVLSVHEDRKKKKEKKNRICC